MVFGVAGLVRVTDGYRGQAVIAAMMFGNALLMLVSGLWIGKSRKVSFFFALAVLAINIILTFTDEFGLYDFGTLVIDFDYSRIAACSQRVFYPPRLTHIEKRKIQPTESLRPRSVQFTPLPKWERGWG